jgi:transcription initiation factor IIE alpha subunit
MSYIAQFHCTQCDKVLTFNQVMNSNGVCPKCGHVTKGTVCSTNKKVVKVERKSWWQRLFS